MKTSAVLLVTTTLIYQISAYLIKVPTVPAALPNVASQLQVIHRQKSLIPLFENVCELSSDPIIRRLADEFAIDLSDYLTPEVVTNFQKLKSSGLIPKGTIFTEYNLTHTNELKIIFDVLYNAKNFDAFYKAAAWLRQNLNCGLYVNAIYMAIINRKDTEQLYIPPPYELLPNYFINKDVIIEASSILNGKEITTNEGVRFEGNSYIIDANYTSMFYDNDDDSKLAYFCEDIGLNSYYFLRKLRMASWLNNDLNSNFGENMYQMMKQLMARYDLERYANGLPEVDSIKFSSVIDVPYDPQLIYSNGIEFGHRISPLNLPETDDILLLQAIESNVVSVVSHMQQSNYNKTQILNHLMEIFVTGIRSYETMARKYLGKDNNQGYVSVLEHYMTSLRDPLFWKINKRIVELIDDALELLPSYAKNELYFPGVEIINVDMKKMITVYDYFEFDVTEALSVEDNNCTFRLKIGQPRLNHKKFTIKVNISSLVSQKGIMKIYLGPNTMPGELMKKKNLLTLLDVFEINLKIGSNIITRSSDSMNHFSEDFISLNTIEKKVEYAEYEVDSLITKTIQSQIGYPSRLILPKGTPQGLPLQLFIFVAPYVKVSKNDALSRSAMEFNTAILSPGYPLDLMTDEREVFELPNAMTKYFTVTQKTDSKVDNYGRPGVSKPWYNTNIYDSTTLKSGSDQYIDKNDYSTASEFKDNNIPNEKNLAINYLYVDGLDEGPNMLKALKFNYGSNYKEPFDYKAKKAQYANRTVNYEKYRTKIKNEELLSSTYVTEILSTTEGIINKVRDKYDEKSDDIVVENDIKIIKANHSLEVEPLSLPAMYSNDLEKIDYKTKKKERDFNIKLIKNELSKLIENAKNRYSTSRMVKPVDTEINTE